MAAPRGQRWRTALPLVAVGLVAAIFIGRLFTIQVVDAASLNAEADGRRGVTSTLWGTRGTIVDANGTVLANSVDRFDITLSPKNMQDFTRPKADGSGNETITVDQSIASIASITGQDPAALHAAIDAATAADPTSNFGYLARMVTLEQYQQIRALRIPWVYYERHPMRNYPNGAVGGNLTGFVGAEGTALAGLEMQYDSCLSAENGQEIYERSADGVEIPGSVVTVKDAKQGGTLQLTIDADVQWKAQQVIAEQVLAMGARSGTVSVLDVKTGEVVAMAEYPSVDPNDPSAIAPEDRGSQIFTSPFEPGSIMKPITAASLFDAGVLSPTDTLMVPDSWDQQGAVFGDDSHHPDTLMNMNGVITESSNVGISLFGQRLSAAQRHDYMKSFGLGDVTTIDFPGQETGTLRPASEWDAQTNYTSMFGQGIAVTVPQMLGAYDALANGGVRMPLSLVRGCTDESGQVIDTTSAQPQRVISAEAATATLTAMEANGRVGWLASSVAIPGYRIGIKTGTAEIADAETGGYVKGSFLTSMAGVAPIDDPRFIVLVTMRNPAKITNSGSTAAAWQETMSYALQHARVDPSPQPWPDISVLH